MRKDRSIIISRIVSFRLSEAKYLQLARVSGIAEQKTPSGVAREIVYNALSDGANDKQLSLSLRLDRLSKEIRELQERIASLIQTVQQ